MTKKVRKILHREIFQRWKDSQPPSEPFDSKFFSQVMNSYFRSKTHPRAMELISAAPSMCNEVRRRIYKRYPDEQMTDEEYRKFMEDIIFTESPFTKILKKSGNEDQWRGCQIQVPYWNKS